MSNVSRKVLSKIRWSSKQKIIIFIRNKLGIDVQFQVKKINIFIVLYIAKLQLSINCH